MIHDVLCSIVNNEQGQESLADSQMSDVFWILDITGSLAEYSRVKVAIRSLNS